jgi:hypothetical protein
VKAVGYAIFPPKRRFNFNGLHGVISQKVVLFFITNAVRTLKSYKINIVFYPDTWERQTLSCHSICTLLYANQGELEGIISCTLHQRNSEFTPSALLCVIKLCSMNRNQCNKLCILRREFLPDVCDIRREPDGAWEHITLHPPIYFYKEVFATCRC